MTRSQRVVKILGREEIEPFHFQEWCKGSQYTYNKKLEGFFGYKNQNSRDSQNTKLLFVFSQLFFTEKFIHANLKSSQN